MSIVDASVGPERLLLAWIKLGRAAKSALVYSNVKCTLSDFTAIRHFVVNASTPEWKQVHHAMLQMEA